MWKECLLMCCDSDTATVTLMRSCIANPVKFRHPALFGFLGTLLPDCTGFRRIQFTERAVTIELVWLRKCLTLYFPYDTLQAIFLLSASVYACACRLVAGSETEMLPPI